MPAGSCAQPGTICTDMQVAIQPGKYVVAVSGGVDSMVLLDVLQKLPGLDLVVAHFEHGIRDDSDQDRQLVERTAQQYGLPFIYERGNLGKTASEAIARDARYAFLRRVLHDQGARAIITAHHQDDALETAILNIIRGTGRKGLSALGTQPDIVRPLLNTPKAALLSYATAHHIVWRDDATNDDDTYMRNYIRHHIMPRLGDAGRQDLMRYVQTAAASNPVIDDMLLADLRKHQVEGGIDRNWFIMLPYDVSCEVIAAWLRAQDIREFDRKGIDRLVVGAKVSQPGKQFDVSGTTVMLVTKRSLQLSRRSASSNGLNRV